MIMKNDEESAEEVTTLLKRLLEVVIDYPRDLELDYRLLVGRTDWRIRGNINDQGKLVGRQGAHIKAVGFIMSAIGNSRGQQYVVRLEEGQGERHPEIGRRPASPTYSCTAKLQLLKDILAEVLEEPAEVQVWKDGCDSPPTFVFTIVAKRIQDYESLVQAPFADESTLIGACGTLFRAAGHCDGVVLKLEVPAR